MPQRPRQEPEKKRDRFCVLFIGVFGFLVFFVGFIGVYFCRFHMLFTCFLRVIFTCYSLFHESGWLTKGVFCQYILPVSVESDSHA